MTNLFTSYFLVDEPARQKELDKCLLNNLSNELIDNVYLILEYPIAYDHFNSEKIKAFYIKSRPTYETFFQFINIRSKDEDINIVANSDIYFDSTIQEAVKMRANECYALTRWEGNEFLNRVDSQDAWIFKGKVKTVRGDFSLGIPGCDNRIAYEINKAGYKVSNPSKTIKSYHIHDSGVRDYKPGRDVVQPPYLTLQPVAL